MDGAPSLSGSNIELGANKHARSRVAAQVMINGGSPVEVNGIVFLVKPRLHSPCSSSKESMECKKV